MVPWIDGGSAAISARISAREREMQAEILDRLHKSLDAPDPSWVDGKEWLFYNLAEHLSCLDLVLVGPAGA